jgi:hypothetical protein
MAVNPALKRVLGYGNRETERASDSMLNVGISE